MTEPTALSKIIPVNLDFNSSSSLNWKPFNTGRAFWTKDIGTAFLEFSTELDLTGTVASIVLENQHDKSLVQKTISGITASPFYYQLGDEIQHDGRWFVQISVTKGEETIVSNSFAFMVNASIGHGKVARLISIETFETLATQLTLLQTSINDYLTTAQESESIRVSTYEEVVLAEQERKDAEDTRKAISMADHYTAQTDHTTAQTDHTTATADHGIAVTDHTTAVSDHSISQSDHSISLTDHTTATEDHGIAVTDHIVAVADHASYEGLLTDGVLTTNIENTLRNLESTYAPELLSVKQQLEQTLNKSAITLTHMFADTAARDAYFVAHPTELMEQLFIKVGTGYQQYLEGAWQSATPILSEQVSASNQQITDTGNYFATDNTNAALQELGAHKASTANPHGVTKAQVGLDNVDNTSDANKPVSTATQTALNLKADKTTTDGINTRLTAEETATANNKVSTVKDKTFTDVDARFEDVETDTTVMATNLFLNGDFSNGTTGWILTNSTLSASNDVLSVIADGTGTSPRVNQILTGASGKKVYMRARVRVTNSNCTSIYLRTGDGMVQAIQTLPVLNTWYNLTVVGNFLTNSIRIDHNYVDSTTANGKVMEVQYVFAIDLTAPFGKGNEPTVEQMDEIMSKFPNSWFDGTKNLFRAKEVLTKQIALDARTEFEAKNLVVNGDFSNGTTGWKEYRVTSTISSGVLNATFTDSGGLVSQPLGDVIAQDKIYIAGELAMVAVDSANTFVRFRLSIGDVYSNILSPTINQLSRNAITRFSAINTASVSGQLFGALYGVGNYAIGDTMKMSKMTVINLTKTFGAGKEPTLAEMDRLMARYPNSWFDGTKPIQTIETLYQEKANKVQEAWITPTLTNGATGTVQYRKDEFGNVEFRGELTGTAGSALLSIPTGYKPTLTKRFNCSNLANIANVFVQVLPNGSLYIGYPYSQQSFDATPIRFSSGG